MKLQLIPPLSLVVDSMIFDGGGIYLANMMSGKNEEEMRENL